MKFNGFLWLAYYMVFIPRFLRSHHPYILEQATSKKLKSWTNVAMWLTNALSVKVNSLRLVVNAVI